MGYDDRRIAADVAGELRGDYLEWLADQFRTRGRLVTALISLLMLAVTMGEWVYQGNPLQYQWLRDVLEVHAQIDSSDLASPLNHRMLLYACRWSSGEWLNAILLFAAFIYLAGAAEARIGSVWMLIVMLGAVWCGAMVQITIDHPDAATIMLQLSQGIEQYAPIQIAGPVTDGLKLLFQQGHPGSWAVGPGAALFAAAVIAVLLPKRPVSWKEQARLLLLAVVLLGVDVSGILRFNDSPVAWGLRIGGMLFALATLPVILGLRLLVAALRALFASGENADLSRQTRSRFAGHGSATIR
jgi:hypothetical protein